MRHLLLFVITFTLTFSNFGWTQNVVVDADGEDGKPASDGTSYSTYSGASYSDGNDGGHARPPTEGKDAGRIQAELKDISQNDQTYTMRLDFTVDGNRNQKTDSINLNLDKLSSILFSAQGGQGQRGGRGGNGQGGCEGRDGSNANRYSTGTNGSSGCDGGNAGKGTSGSNGGQGGVVKISLSEEDTHLLLKTRCDIEGGRGGEAGKHGDPGQGGNGGRGGSSYTWSESQRCNCGNRQSSNGNGSFTYTYECDTCYESHSKSGGYNGSSGSMGSRQYESLFSGKNGEQGRCEIIVNENGVNKTYTNPFDVSIISYDISDENQDSIFEPNETVTVSKIRIKNKNGVPTPAKKAQLKFYISSSNLIAESSNQITVPQLKAGQEIVLNESLRFKLKVVKIDSKSKSWSESQDVDFNNFVTRVNTELRSLKKQDRITVEFPFEVTTFKFPKSGAAGETHPVIWKIKNKSSKGMSVKDELSKRNITLELKSTKINSKEKSSENQAEAVFTDEFGKVFSLEQGFAQSLVELGPGQELTVHGSITISENAQPYTSIPVNYLFSINTFKTDKTQVIQSDYASLRISTVYRHNPAADVLLITNKSVTSKQYQYWTRLMNKLGLKLNVWDVDYYNIMTFYKEYEKNKTLADDFKNKNVIILNSHTQSISGSLYSDFFKLISKNNTRVLMIGGSEYENQNALKQILSINDSQLNQNFPLEVQNKITLTEFKLFGREVTDEKLKSEAAKIAQQLKASYPESRFTIKTTDQRVENQSFAGTQPVAQVEIFKTISHQGAHIYSIPTLRTNKYKQDILSEEEAWRALFLSFSVDLKFKTLFYNRDKDAKLQKIIGGALVYDIIGDLLFTKNLTEVSKAQVKPSVLSEVLTFIYKDLKFVYSASKLVSQIEWYLKKEKSIFMNPDWLVRSLKSVESYQGYLKQNQKMICQFQTKEMQDKCLSEDFDKAREQIFTELDLKYKKYEQSTPLEHEQIIKNIFIKPAVDQVISTEDATRENVILYK